MGSLRSILVAIACAAVVAAVVGMLVIRGERLPEGPEPVAWDREACAECRMHVGDPRFAVQLQMTDGQVLNFDDPGCFFLLEARERPDVHALYFHDVREDRWLTQQQARFVRMEGTPMGSSLVATGASPVGWFTLDEARVIALKALAAGSGH